MTRLLWVTDMANPAPRAGGGLRSLRLVQAAARRWSVDVVSLAEGLDEKAYLEASGAASVRSVMPAVSPRWTTAGRALRRRWPMPVSRRYDEGLAREVSAAAASGNVVVVEHGWLLGYLPRSGSAVVVLHNVDSELVRELPGRSTAYDVAAYRALERRLARRALVTVVSERDAMLIPGAVVVPNGADVPADVSPVPADGPVVFVGSMGYPPNIAAVEWWVREVWRPELPPLTVVGQNAAAALRHLTGNEAVRGRLRVVGEVPDVTPWLEQARVVAVPVISGSGTRLKVIEGLAYGRPVVTTIKGAEGTGATAEHVLYADAPADFALAVRRLLDDDELAARLARTGREFAKELSWDAIGERFVAAVSKVAS